MNKLKLGFLSFLLVAAFIPSAVHAQGPPPLDDDPGVPIDGGASLLVGAAVIYGAKKLKDRQARKK